MTREEAKNWLRKLYARADITDEYGDMEDMQPYEEALDMAISALSDYDKLMTIAQQLAFENEELRENIEKTKAEIEHMACKQYEHRLTLDRQEVIEILDSIGKGERR